jgi:hypothetical protein
VWGDGWESVSASRKGRLDEEGLEGVDDSSSVELGVWEVVGLRRGWGCLPRGGCVVLEELRTVSSRDGPNLAGSYFSLG